MGIGVLLKQWKGERVFLFPFVCVICGLFVILRGSMDHLVRVEWLDIDPIPIVLVYLLAKDQEFRASCLAFFMGLLTDIFAPSQLGLFAFVYTTITLGISRCRLLLDFNSTKAAILFVAAFLLAKWAFLLIVLRLFPAGQLIPSISYASVLVSALITSSLALLLFHGINLAGGAEGLGRGQRGSLASLQ
jgi:cell shape-determining protein MreD